MYYVLCSRYRSYYFSEYCHITVLLPFVSRVILLSILHCILPFKYSSYYVAHHVPPITFPINVLNAIPIIFHISFPITFTIVCHINFLTTFPIPFLFKFLLHFLMCFQFLLLFFLSALVTNC